jgi:hypothetical protein
MESKDAKNATSSMKRNEGTHKLQESKTSPEPIASIATDTTITDRKERQPDYDKPELRDI